MIWSLKHSFLFSLISSSLVGLPVTVHAQRDSLSSEKQESVRKRSIFSAQPVTYKSYIAPALLIGFGTVATVVRENKNGDVVNTSAKGVSPFLRPENYTALAPVAAVAGLNLLGIKGKHKPTQQALLFAMSAGLSSAIVYPLKNSTHILRPDHSDFKSFPSGHATIAFVAAEFLRREYGHVSPWYTIAGYATATATAIIRVAKNEHWLADVSAGAGIGMASTATAYWLFDRFTHKKKRKEQASIFLLPAVSTNYYGVYFIKSFR